ncbi:hypothetical protein HHL28_16935 [Aerophototrophica crusticola]|uniref:Uncharacterized protein n=1 Tax=Aerophototrophica crusticola TaxID=1709002 RepID=A0A858RC62_9PROT|nr:hypothetical protein HHL28_16935 [Rhodospirillaceae bacterium B3]
MSAATLAQAVTLPLNRLPFVGERLDGKQGYWVIPGLPDGTDLRLQGRTYAAWLLLYAEVNGNQAAQDLLDRIEREMPSRYPALDRVFLAEVHRRL